MAPQHFRERHPIVTFYRPRDYCQRKWGLRGMSVALQEEIHLRSCVKGGAAWTRGQVRAVLFSPVQSTRLQHSLRGTSKQLVTCELEETEMHATAQAGHVADGATARDEEGGCRRSVER